MTVGPGYGVARPGMRMGSRAQMRAASADREHSVELLKSAYADGRLGKDEYDGRLERALSATTYADLDAVVADLPVAKPSARRTNGLAIASLACGAGQIVAGPLTTIPAIVLGHMARKQIRHTGEEGGALALTGMLLGYAGAALIVLGVLFVLFVVVTFAHTAGVAVHPVVRVRGG
ncbi:MAG TPA: DUF1707 and DUF4190 domain-containing protein [Streptosporangiaceae bacterium]|nr:DUF1707 and DUF4190 domain-containing protein [Streptosporangiaceae bacterium]